MKNFSVINRTGILNLKGQSVPNQCVSSEQEVFGYDLKILFSPDVNLDENGFIIDNNILHNEIISNAVVDSCERMAGKILDIIKQVLKVHRIKYIGISIKIQKAFGNSGYYQQYCVHKTSDMVLILNL